MHAWSRPLTAKSALVNLGETRCRYDEGKSSQHGPLLLIMRYYVEYVQPACPRRCDSMLSRLTIAKYTFSFRDNCTCLLTKVQEGEFQEEESRVYSVQVDCVNQSLSHFPKLPKHTRAVDLSGNRVSEIGRDVA